MFNVNILMLGGQGSGKTCFLLGMYDDMRYGRDAFSFAATDPDKDAQLSELWDKLENSAGEERFPVPTVAMEEYEMSLNYAMKRFMTFSWTDYPGGSLYERGQLQAALKEHLTKANGILVCLPGDQILNYVQEGQRALRTMNIGHIVQMLSEFGQINPDGARPALILVITKFDLFVEGVVESRRRPEWMKRVMQLDIRADADDLQFALQLVEQLIKKAFNVAFGVLSGEEGWNVLICPVTLGMALANDPDNGQIRVENMHYPVLFTYVESGRGLKSKWDKERREQGVQVAGLKDSYMEWFKSLVKKGNLKDASASLAELEAQLKLVTDRLAVVEESIPDEAMIYRNGTRVSGPKYGDGG